MLLILLEILRMFCGMWAGVDEICWLGLQFRESRGRKSSVSATGNFAWTTSGFDYASVGGVFFFIW